MMCFQYNGGQKRCLHGRMQEKVDGKWVDVKGQQEIKKAIQEMNGNNDEEQFKNQDQGEQKQQQFQEGQKEQTQNFNQEKQPQSQKDQS